MADESTDDNPGTGTADTAVDSTDYKALAEKWEKRAKANEAGRLTAEDRIRQQTMTEHEKALDVARREAADQARKETTDALNRRLVAAELRAAAGGLLADPGDAARFIDVDHLDVDKDGQVATKTAIAAVERLLKDKPYLGAGTTRPGSADGGARGGPPNQDMNTLLRRAAGRQTT